MKKKAILAGVFAMIYAGFAFSHELFRGDVIALFCCSLWCFAFALAARKKKAADPRVTRLIETIDDLDNLRAIALMALVFKPDAAETEEIFQALMTRESAAAALPFPSSSKLSM